MRPPPLTFDTMTQQPAPNQNVWKGSTQSNYSGTSPYEPIANMKPAAGGNNFPQTPPLTTNVGLQDNNGNSAYTGGLSNIQATTTLITGNLNITTNGGGNFTAPPLTITITLTYGYHKPTPANPPPPPSPPSTPASP